MKVENMTSSRGNIVVNQLIITWQKDNESYTVFQSYKSVIAFKHHKHAKTKIYLDCNTWDYSRTTGKYRNVFLNENKAETQKKIDSGEYILADLNGADK